MQTRKGTKGPGQGDSAVAQETREEREKEAESLKEMEPSSTTGLRVSVEKEVEAMKETTSKLEQEVRMLRSFAQDTLELLKELREERDGAKQTQTAPAYYGAQDMSGTAKSSMQGNGASAALYGALAALPEKKVPHYPLHSTEL